jgi:hypothetical protein
MVYLPISIWSFIRKAEWSDSKKKRMISIEEVTRVHK